MSLWPKFEPYGDKYPDYGQCPLCGDDGVSLYDVEAYNAAFNASYDALVAAAQAHADAFWALLNTEFGTPEFDQPLAHSMKTYDALRAALDGEP
jgi:hypothetical protein